MLQYKQLVFGSYALIILTLLSNVNINDSSQLDDLRISVGDLYNYLGRTWQEKDESDGKTKEHTENYVYNCEMNPIHNSDLWTYSIHFPSDDSSESLSLSEDSTTAELPPVILHIDTLRLKLEKTYIAEKSFGSQVDTCKGEDDNGQLTKSTVSSN